MLDNITLGRNTKISHVHRSNKHYLCLCTGAPYPLKYHTARNKQNAVKILKELQELHQLTIDFGVNIELQHRPDDRSLLLHLYRQRQDLIGANARKG